MMNKNTSSLLPLQTISSSKLNEADTTDKKRKLQEISDDDDVSDEYEMDNRKIRRSRYVIVPTSVVMMMSERERERTEIYRKISVKWTEKEVLTLLYLVHNLGKSWREMQINYAEHFQNRTQVDLRSKYSRLIKQQNFETLQNEAKLFNEVTLVERNMGKTEWTNTELTYLFVGVERFGTSWSHMLEVYKPHFNHRSGDCLKQKYRCLEKDQDRFEYFQEQAMLFLEN